MGTNGDDLAETIGYHFSSHRCRRGCQL